jgi:hypothetical protein
MGHVVLIGVSPHDYAVVVDREWIGADSSWNVESDVLVMPQ